MRKHALSKARRLLGIGFGGGLAAVVLVLAAAPALAGGQGGGPEFLKGNIIRLDGQNTAFAVRMDQAGAQARRSGGGSYFTAYIFESRHRVHYGRNDGSGQGFSVAAKNARIRVDEKNRIRQGTSIDSEDEPAPAVLLALRDPGKGDGFVDLTLLDPEQAYEVEGLPVYWLGRATADESLDFLDKAYAATEDEQARKSLHFAVSSHLGPRPVDILKKASLGPGPAKVRESAVFWLGNIGDARSFAALKDVYGREKEGSVKKQVVFALQLSKQKEALEELIRIAKHESDADLRKNAIFWLGQKASTETVKALTDIVGSSAEEDPIKDQAVFAISQLPKERSVPLLIDIARKNKTASIRKKAIFWLGQSGDPAALAFFEEILLKK